MRVDTGAVTPAFVLTEGKDDVAKIAYSFTKAVFTRDDV
jgi:hypothetical protein